MLELPTLLPKAAPSLLPFKEPPRPLNLLPPKARLNLGVNLLPAEAAPAAEVAPALESAAALPLTLSVGASVALALGLVLATPETTADEDAILKQKREESLLQPAENPQAIQPFEYPFYGGQSDRTMYGVSYKLCSEYAFGGCQVLYQEVWGTIGGMRILRPDTVPTNPGVNYGVSWQILCHNRLPYAYSEQQFWVNLGSFGETSGSPATVEIISIVRLDGQPDPGNPAPINQPIYSAPGKTLSSPAPYARTIGDRPVPEPALQLQPAAAPKVSPQLDFAEPKLLPLLLSKVASAPKPDPSLQPLLLPTPNLSSDTAPDIANEAKTLPAPALKINPAPAPNAITLYGPSSDPGSIKTIQEFAPNPQTRAPEPLPLLLPKPKIEPKPELTPIEKIEKQTSPEALKNAAAEGTCQSLQADGCMAPLAKNAEAAANTSVNNAKKLDELNAGLNAAQLANSTFWISVEVPTVTCELGENDKYAPKRSYTSIQVEATATGSEAQQVLTQFEEIAKTAESACYARNNEVIFAPPERWDMKPGSDIPQLAVIFRQDLGKGKLGKSCYTLYIPHYFSSSPPQKSPLPAYNKGSYQGTYVCKDNSNVIVYAKSKSEAEIIINAAKAVIKPAMLSNSPARFGEIKGDGFMEFRLIPVRAQYFSKGRKQSYPDWTAYFDK